MNPLCQLLFFLLCVNFVIPQGPGSGQNGNLRLCIVEGRGQYKRGAKYCPVLDEENSKIECVLGTDRLDCLRRISKGTVDFGVFSPEDLVAARWANVDVLVTNELRDRDKQFERSVVAVVNRRILPDSAAPLTSILRNSSLCHPGVGLDDLRPLSDTLSGYLESLVLTRSCDPNLSLSENRIKALAEFFGRACKAGPWVPEPTRNAELKKKYPSLCAACRSSCSENDRYWGDGGALACLSEGAGDVMWSELNDVKAYFKDTATDHLAYLCRDGSWQSMANNTDPCVWLNRPWPVIVAKRKAAAAVSALTQSISASAAAVDQHWRGALAALLELRAAPIPLYPPRAPLDHLATARGFREAYSQSGCDPPRHITLCTKSVLEKNKCEWLSEASAVYGITPPLQCTIRASTRDCMASVRDGDSDVIVADSDSLVSGMRDYGLTAVLHEATPIVEKTHTVVAYIRKDAKLKKMTDLRGKRAVFPRFDGVAWHSVSQYFADKLNVPCEHFISFFGEICAPGIQEHNATAEIIDKLTKNCLKDDGNGELNALRSLIEGKSDVAFFSMRTYNKYKANIIHETWAQNIVDIIPICPEENPKYCFISWSNIGHVFVSKKNSQMRKQEIINVFTKLDQLFGKHQPFHSPMFSMYGQFNHQMDVLFHNNTKNLASNNMLKFNPYDRIPFNFERTLTDVKNDTCQTADLSPDSSFRSAPTILLCIISLVVCFLYR
ncbi:transferrin [Papilio machaon]|uniref:transferrin n=1 Tax=Papilio machaon TaxID=76193 RepID=UPI001E66455E|nr:transferrin [Papilio machaon]